MSVDNSSSVLQKLDTNLYTGVTVLFTIITVFGVGLNVAALFCAFYRKVYYHWPNVFLIAVHISSLAIAACAHPLMTMAEFLKMANFTITGCEIYGFVVTFFGLAEINLFTAAAVGYYLYVVCDIKSPTTRLSCAICGCYGLAMLWAIAPLLGWNAYVPEGFLSACCVDWTTKKRQDQIYIFLMLFFEFILPVGVIIVFHMRLFIKVSRRADGGRRQSSHLPAFELKRLAGFGVKRLSTQTRGFVAERHN